jgi:hypothetical protein
MNRFLAFALAGALAVTGCSAGSDEAPPPPAAPAITTSATGGPPRIHSEDWGDPPPADAADTSYPACALPVTFDLADKWAAKAVSGDTAGVLGPHPVVCEIDGKPAGVVGFIRVFKAATTEVQFALVALIPEEHQKGTKYRQFGVPDIPGAEISYGPADKPQRAFAVTIGTETVVVHWGGLDAEEHKAGLPAYLLAQASLARRG